MAGTRKRVLLSCIGSNDAGALEKEREGKKRGDGTILSILAHRRFDEVWLLWNEAKTKDGTPYRDILAYLRREIHERHGLSPARIHDRMIAPRDVADHLSVFPEMKATLEKIFQEPGLNHAEVFAGISSGTPAMQISWVLFAEADMFPLKLLRSIEEGHARGGERVRDIPLGTDILPKIQQWRAYQKIFAGEEKGDLFTVEDPTNLSPDLLRVLEKADKIFIHGETGTGKEVLANTIAEALRLRNRLVPVNCGAIPRDLIESELFGHEKGAFTGADKQKPGLIEQSDKGIIFLDEINSMPLDVQVKLLRFLDNGSFRRIGGVKEQTSKARVIAASNGDIMAMIEKGEFRQDLFYRLREIELFIPPLRERRHRIGPLVREFLAEKEITRPLPASVLSILEEHPYPGNVRELRLLVMRLLHMHPDLEGLTPTRVRTQLARLSTPVGQDPVIPDVLHGKVMDLVKQLLAQLAVQQTGSQNKAAQLLGVTHPTVKKLVEGGKDR